MIRFTGINSRITLHSFVLIIIWYISKNNRGNITFCLLYKNEQLRIYVTLKRMNNILLFKTEYCSNIKFMDKFLKALFYKVFMCFV